MNLDRIAPIRSRLTNARDALKGGTRRGIADACREIGSMEIQRPGSALSKDLGDECARIFEALCYGSLREEGTTYRPRDLSKAQFDELVVRLDAVLAAIA